MIKYFNGDLLTSGCDIICHQVNQDGIFGGGLALQIYNKFPNVEKNLQKAILKDKTIKTKRHFDLEFCGFQNKGGQMPQYISNIFSQDKDYNTRYDWLDTAIENLLKHIETIEHILPFKRIGFPYNYGCGIANGDWKEVEKILKKHFENNTKYDCEIWKI